MDQKVYDALEKWASDELRSVNAQIETSAKKVIKRCRKNKRKRLVNVKG